MGNKDSIRSDGPDALTLARGRAIAAIAKAAARMAKDHARRNAAPNAKAKVSWCDCEHVAEACGKEIIADLIRATMLTDPERIGRIADLWAPKKASERAPAGGTAAELLAGLSGAAED